VVETLCQLCGRDVKIGDEALVLRQGEIKTSRKHGGPYFQPDDYNDGDEEKIFHVGCWLGLFDMSGAEGDLNIGECVFCPEDLAAEDWFYELELAEMVIDGRQKVPIPKKDNDGKDTRVYACQSCIYDNISPGDQYEANRILALESIDEHESEEPEEKEAILWKTGRPWKPPRRKTG